MKFPNLRFYLQREHRHKSKSFVICIYFNGAPTSPVAACSVNNEGCDKEASQNIHHFPNVYFQVTFSLPLLSLLLKLPTFCVKKEVRTGNCHSTNKCLAMKNRHLHALVLNCDEGS